MINNDGQAFVRGEEHAMALLVGSLAEAWGTWLQAWQVLAGMGTGSRGAALDPFIGSKQNMTKSFEAVSARADGVGGVESQLAAAAKMADVSPALAEAWMAGAASAMRYWGTLAELGLQYETSLAQAIAGRTTVGSAASPMECRVIADELRAFLRGLGDAANREARLLQLDLERIGEAIAEAADQATPPSHPHERRRRHEVKL
jgi:hypothetical protein